MSNTPSPSAPANKEQSDSVIIDGQTGEVVQGTETAPETPTPDASETPEVAAGEGPAVTEPPADDAQEEPSPTTITADRGAPCDWNIKPSEDGIVATNRHSNEVYEGSVQGFNEMLRG